MSRQKVLVDSDILVGLFKKNDSHFLQVKKKFKELQVEDATLYISDYVFSECVTVISQKVSHAKAIEFIYFVKEQTNAALTSIRLSEDIEELAIEIFKRQTSKNVSFVDCTNMALIETRQVDKIWSFDEIYKKNKCETVS